MFVPDEAPVNSVRKIEKENKSCHKMNETYCSEPVTERRFRGTLNGQGAANEVACNAEYHDAECIDPVIKPDRQLPDIVIPDILSYRFFFHGTGLKCLYLMNITAVFIIQVNCTGNTRIE